MISLAPFYKLKLFIYRSSRLILLQYADEWDLGWADLVGRGGEWFVFYVVPGGEKRVRVLELVGQVFSPWPYEGYVRGRPFVIFGGRWWRLFGFVVEGVFEGGFRPLCVPPIEGSRWWVYAPVAQFFDFLKYPPADDVAYVLAPGGLRVVRQHGFYGDVVDYSLCKCVFYRPPPRTAYEANNLVVSPIGPPLTLPGRGSLLGAELPVVRRRLGYLRVGEWLAWHRVLGVLDYQPGEAAKKWVVVGDDGLYVAEFVPTAKEPLEEIGEVGYVKVVAPYEGDVDDVASPCGAPRLVACTEETTDLLRSLGHRCEAERGVPHVLLGSPEEVALGREALDWPLADTCSVYRPGAHWWHL